MMRRRKLNRLHDYDYSQTGWYFVTICTRNREEFFGEIKNQEMVFNERAWIVKKQWLWLACQYKGIKLDQFIIMPNHIHGIVVINSRDRSRPVPTNPRPVPTVKTKSLSGLMGAFKTTSSKLIHQQGFEYFAWQRSFYDHTAYSQ